jgi:flagellar protein FliL
MDAPAEPVIEKPKKASKLPLIIGVFLALIGAGGGFFAASSGLLFGGNTPVADANHSEPSADPPALSVAFVPIDTLVISLPATNGRDHLRFAAQLEVPPNYLSEVTALKPRIVDVLNGYLRAVALAELEDPTALARMRSQMLRRVQVVAGEGRVNDLLIMEFVLS